MVMHDKHICLLFQAQGVKTPVLLYV